MAYRYGLGLVPEGMPKEVRKRVPILIVLRKYREQLCQASPLSLPEFITEHHIPSLPESHQLQPVPSGWAKEVLQKGRALVMFDGFDEVPKAERPKVARWMTEQMRQYGKSVFVVASRPKAYKDKDSADRLVMSMPMWVQPFDDEQRQNFVMSWYLCQEILKARREGPEVRKVAREGAQDLLQQIEAEAELKDLAKNPLLLNMIATFHRLYPGAALPKRRVDLYGEICALQLKNRPRDRRLNTVLLEFDPQPVLEEVAFGMMQQTLKRIDEDALLEALQKELSTLDEKVEAADLLREVVRISQLIVEQEGEYEFAHLSFQEYLAAAYVAAEPQTREPLLYGQFEQDWWKATILLYAGKTRKPSRLIREALRQGKTDFAYACLQQTTKRVDAELRAELESLMSQVKDARYADLERYLKNGEWQAADKETYRLMITEVDKEEGQLFSSSDLLNFPCEPLKVIDGMWVKYSGGRFGFSVQKEIYLACGGAPDGKLHKEALVMYYEMVGWDRGKKFDISSPKGHLPRLGKKYGNSLLSHPDL